MPQRSDNAQRVYEFTERRKAAGETARQFYVRQEHLQILRRFQTQHGYANQHSALQALLELYRAEHHTGAASSSSQNGNPKRGGS